MSTLFEKYGGLSTISVLTRLFYQKLLDSPQVSHFFAQTDIEKLIDHQTQFLSSALGGPQMTHEVDLVAAHKNLDITEQDYEAVVEILEETLMEKGVEQQDITDILQLISQFKDKIISE